MVFVNKSNESNKALRISSSVSIAPSAIKNTKAMHTIIYIYIYYKLVMISII